MKNKDCDCRTTFPSATADNGILDIKNRKSVPGTCCEDPFPDVIVKFEDQTENIDVAFEDQSEEINVTMADVGTTLIQKTSDVRKGETSFWNNQPGLVSERNVLYIYTDYYRKENEETGEVTYAPGLKIGDGSAYLIDLPFITGITQDDIKDVTARTEIENIKDAIAGGVHYMGVTTTALTDGATTKPIKINNADYDQIKGDVVNYGAKEFIWDGTKWNELGDLGAFKALAYKDTASASYKPAGTVSKPTFTGTSGTLIVKGTPEGTVSKPTFTGTQGTVTVSGKPTGTVTISKGTGTANYTPQGTVSQPTFTGTSFTSSGTYKPEGSVTISKAASGTANYTPEGSVSAPTFTGEALTSSGTYKPEGTVSTPTITVTPNTTTVNSITAVGTLPAFTATVASENLTLSWDAGTLPTKGANTTVATGIKSATSSQPTFTGTSKSVSVSGTPAGTVSAPTFTGTGAVLTGSFSGTSKSVSVSGTPTGTVSQPTFTGTGAELKASFSGTSFNSTGNFTPAGTVSQPTFTGEELTSSGEFTPEGTVSQPTFNGTQATITVS